MFNENRFKFRIYDKETKEMFYFKLGEKLFSPNFDTYFKQNPQKILMQCTGVKDRNDKLIYEGDIIQCRTEPTSDIVIRYVKYKEGVYTCQKEDSDYNKPLCEYYDIQIIHELTI